MYVNNKHQNENTEKLHGFKNKIHFNMTTHLKE